MRWWNLLLRVTALESLAQQRLAQPRTTNRPGCPHGRATGRCLGNSHLTRQGKLLFDQHAPALFANGHACYKFVVHNARLIEAAIQDMKLDLTGLLCAEAKVGAGRSKREVDMQTGSRHA